MQRLFSVFLVVILHFPLGFSMENKLASSVSSAQGSHRQRCTRSYFVLDSEENWCWQVGHLLIN
jgi:hypothetical protein